MTKEEQLASAIADRYKDVSDQLWDMLGDSIQNVPDTMKKNGATLGKQALTTQLLMMLYFPDEATMLADTFNIMGEGHTGSKQLGGLYEVILDKTANMAQKAYQQAMNAQMFADFGKTSMIGVLSDNLPQLFQEALQETPEDTKGKSKKESK